LKAHGQGLAVNAYLIDLAKTAQIILTTKGTENIGFPVWLARLSG